MTIQIINQQKERLIRDGSKITSEILEFCKEPRLKYHIIYKCNLNSVLFKIYFAKLSNKGLIERKGLKHFVTTLKGLQFLNLFQSSMKIFGD